MRLTEDDRLAARLTDEYRNGTSVKDLAEQYGRSEHYVREAIRAARLQQILDLPLDYIPSAEFVDSLDDAGLLAAFPEQQGKHARKGKSGLSPYIAALYETPLLSPEHERHLFRQYNYLKYRASELRESLDLAKPDMRQMDKIEQYNRLAAEVRERIARANLRLVVSLVKKHASLSHGLSELISEGNVALLNAIEKFDYSRGFKFSTYATWAIVNSIRRSIPRDLTRASRFQSAREEALDAQVDYRDDPLNEESRHSEHQTTVNRLLKHLDAREKKVISNRFGLDYRKEPKTLKQVGELLGVSKERARQLERRAISKLRNVVGGELESLLN